MGRKELTLWKAIFRRVVDVPRDKAEVTRSTMIECQSDVITMCIDVLSMSVRSTNTRRDDEEKSGCLLLDVGCGCGLESCLRPEMQ